MLHLTLTSVLYSVLHVVVHAQVILHSLGRGSICTTADQVKN